MARTKTQADPERYLSRLWFVDFAADEYWRITAIAHRLCRLIWMILHEGVRYQERGPSVSRKRAQERAAKILRELRSLGYRVEVVPPPSGSPA